MSVSLPFRVLLGAAAVAVVLGTCKPNTSAGQEATSLSSRVLGSSAHTMPGLQLSSGPHVTAHPANSHAFWQAHPDEWPYSADDVKVRDLAELSDKPTRADEKMSGGGWWAQYGPQGLAHDDEHYFASTRTHLFKWHRSRGLGAIQASSANSVAKIPNQLARDGYNHFGDPDFEKGLLYVPLEPKNMSDHPMLLATFDRHLTVRDWDELSHNSSAPWVAVHPLNPRLIFTSEFNGSSAAPVTLHVYKNEGASAFLSLEYLSPFQVNDSDGSGISLHEIQGGEFDPSGDRLYMVAQGGTYGPGVYVFNMRTGRLEAFSDQSDHLAKGQEFEGVTYWDLDATMDDAGIDGHIHFLTWHHNWWPTTPSTYWSKHLRVQTGNSSLTVPNSGVSDLEFGSQEN